MAERRKFNLGNSGLNTREPNGDVSVESKSSMQKLVNSIQNPAVNTAFNFKYIPRDKLVFHKENHYPMEAIEKLAASILDMGLMHNIDVSYDEETDTYIIDAGEQRTKAIDLLIERYKDFPETDSEDYQRYLYHVQPFEKGYPCKVSTGSSRMKMGASLSEDVKRELDKIESRMRIRISNEIGRDPNPVRTKAAIDEMIKLENQRNKLLGNVDGSSISNKEIGDRLNISSRMVQKYKAIDRLIPELREIFEQKGITLTDGANYANLDETEQRQLLSLIEAGGDKKEIHALYEKLNKLQNEMKSKEKELQSLEKEKAEALKLVENARRDAAELEKKIRTELQHEMEEEGENDRKVAEQLQEELEAANQSIERYEKQREKLEEEQAKKVAELEKKLAEQEKEGNTTSFAVTRVALQIDNILNSIDSQTKQLNRMLEEYEGIYQVSSGETAPETYKKKFEQILKEIRA